MPIPALIEIIPPGKPVCAAITVPGSKSITNRALILAALAPGETVLSRALWSEDTQVMVDCLQELGFMVNVQADPDETCNRIITVFGKGGDVPRGGTVASPVDLFIGNAGTAARFLMALVCLGEGVYRLHGVERMHQRPQRALMEALRQLGYRIDSANDRLPALIHGRGPRAGKCRVSIEQSSQFASALLLCAHAASWEIEVYGENADESPYVRMTHEMIQQFKTSEGRFRIEPDASSGSYFVAAGLLLGGSGHLATKCDVSVVDWPGSGWQADEAFPPVARRMSRAWSAGRPAATTGFRVSRKGDLGDSIMTAMILAPFADAPVQFGDLGRLRLQECERVVALRTELARCGAKVVEEGDELTVYPSQLHGAEIETYEDHRMAMCFATLGLKVRGVRIRNPGCVRKTFPDFFLKLAAAPPAGIGAEVQCGATGKPLAMEDLFAD